MLHDCLKDYVDGIDLKSREAHHHIDDLRKVFVRYKQYNLQMNTFRCAFAVFKKVFRVHYPQKKIDLDSATAKASKIWSFPQPVKSFIRRVSYVRRLIPTLAELL